jgi:hypothetical protein
MPIHDGPYRLATETSFPYGGQRVCFFARRKTGQLHQLQTKAEKVAALLNAQRGDLDIFAVWPGEYRSDLFLIDDLNKLAVGWGVEP